MILLMALDDRVLDWSGYFAPAQNLQTYWFQIGSDRADHNLSIHRADGTVVPLDQPWWTTPGANYFTTWDNAGNQIDYHYENYEASVDVNQAWTLFDISGSQ